MRHKTTFLSQPVTEAVKHLGSRLRIARKAAGLSLSELESITRTHRTTLGRLERGEDGVSIGTLFAVLEALNELSEMELVLSRPDVPKQLRTPIKPVLDQDF
ncbi:helix-turn-helix transcriptional regulator [Undibacterium sp. FT79W]|nr:helix-turn-helix transcriptional regulator [Undibacterium sp. FT79W]